MSIVPFNASSSDWVLISPARPRQSLRSANASRNKRNVCAALCPGGTRCSLPLSVDGIKWCSRHNEERIKLYTNYKAHGKLLEAYPDVAACHDVATCDSLSLLREWNSQLRGRYNLLTRCIEARDYFTKRFFGEDMDFGHKKFWDNLVRERCEVEQLMLKVQTRGYQLILECQNAQWVLEQDTHESTDCSSYGSLTHDTNASSFHSTESAEGAAIEDPLEAILREKAIKFREKIWMCLAQYCAPATSLFRAERLEVINAYVRRAIYKDASLMFLSQSYDNVLTLLGDQDLDLVTTEKIWHALEVPCLYDIRSAVDDVLRSTDGDHVVVLGGKVFKDVSGDRWPLHAWGHMIAFCQCYSCLRTICRTIDEVIDLTRYALLTRAPISQVSMKYDFNFDGARELILAGFITHDIPLSSPRHSIVYKESASHSTGPVWEETQRNLVLRAGLSLSDPMAQMFVNACLRHPDFMVMLRKGENALVIRSPPLIWTSRKRYASVPSALTSVPWEKTPDVVRLLDTELKDAQPLGWSNEKIAECMQVIIVDASEGTMGNFIRKLVAIWCQVHSVGDKDALYETLRRPYETTGELETYVKVTDKIAHDYYRDLWGCDAPCASRGPRT